MLPGLLFSHHLKNGHSTLPRPEAKTLGSSLNFILVLTTNPIHLQNLMLCLQNIRQVYLFFCLWCYFSGQATIISSIPLKWSLACFHASLSYSSFAAVSHITTRGTPCKWGHPSVISVQYLSSAFRVKANLVHLLPLVLFSCHFSLIAPFHKLASLMFIKHTLLSAPDIFSTDVIRHTVNID